MYPREREREVERGREGEREGDRVGEREGWGVRCSHDTQTGRF